MKFFFIPVDIKIKNTTNQNANRKIININNIFIGETETWQHLQIGIDFSRFLEWTAVPLTRFIRRWVLGCYANERFPSWLAESNPIDDIPIPALKTFCEMIIRHILSHTNMSDKRKKGGGNGVKIGLLCKWVAGNLIGRFTDKSKRKKEEGQKKTGESQDSLKNAQWSRGKKKNIHLNNSPLSREIFISNKKKYIYIYLFIWKGKKKKDLVIMQMSS